MYLFLTAISHFHGHRKEIKSKIIDTRKAVQSKKAEDRRRHRRRPYRTEVVVSVLATGAAATGKLEDLSISGCYIETLVPLEERTRIRVRFRLKGEELQALGVVRYARPGLGMGVEFTQLEPKQQELPAGFLQQ